MDAAGIEVRLRAIGAMPDGDVPIVETLTLISGIETNIFDFNDIFKHFEAMHHALSRCIEGTIQAKETTAAYRLARLNSVIFHQFGYKVEPSGLTADTFEDSSFLHIIDKRRGFPVALGILYLDLARSQGWVAHGLSFPRHFLIRLDFGAERLIVDPADGKALDAPGLRRLLKSVVGDKAELQHNYYDPITPRDVVLRFCNNRKTRLITQGDYESALQVIGHEMWVAPREPRLYYETAILCVKTDRIVEALEALYHVVELSSDPRLVIEAKNMIRTLQHGVH